MTNHDPIITRHEDGRVSVEWPDPARPFYPVSHDLIQMFVDIHNDQRARDERIIDAALDWDSWDPTYSGPPAEYDRIIAAAETPETGRR